MAAVIPSQPPKNSSLWIGVTDFPVESLVNNVVAAPKTP